jgi:hypothetical protein
MSDTTETQVPSVDVKVAPGAMTATVSTDALVPEPKEDAGLLAGKFKTPSDLEKAYKELESKLGQQKPQQPAEEPKTEQTTETPEGNEEAETEEAEYGPYGKAVAEALKSAEVDPTAANEEFVKNGTLSDATFEKFAKAGFPKEVVDAYLRGVSQTYAAQNSISETQVSQIKAIAGGDEGFSKLSTWMATNLSAAEIEAYNADVASGDYAKAVDAVSRVNNRYRSELGTEGRLLGGKAPSAASGYVSEAEMLDDMKNPKYKTSQAFRDQVTAKIAASPNIFLSR